jgi:hypothetical protein
MPLPSDQEHEEKMDMLIQHALLQAAATLRATLQFTTAEAVEEAMRLHNCIREIEI